MLNTPKGITVVTCMQAGAQYTQKAPLYSPSKAQAADSRQVDDLGMDASKQGKRWFPFSDGPRNCVGQALAKMNMAATFAQLYSHFTFQLAEEVQQLIRSMPALLIARKIGSVNAETARLLPR